MKVIALIPARGGSKRIPRKNLARVGGRTLVERAVWAAQGSQRVSATYVSTDDAEIRDVAISAGARVRDRPPLLARDDSTTEVVVADFLEFAQLDADDVVVILEPTAPLRDPDDIDAIADLMIATGAPAARTVHVDPLGCHGEVYRDVGLAQAIRVGSFGRCLFPEGTLLLHAGDARAVDVNEPADLARLVVAVQGP